MISIALLLCLLGLGDEPSSPRALEVPFPVCDVRTVDLAGDGKERVLLVGVEGEVRTWRGGPAEEVASGPSISDPERSLLAFESGKDQVLGGRLFVLGPDGLLLHEVADGGRLVPEATRLASRARFRIRVGVPTFAPFLQDLNEDGFPDVVLPTRKNYELWVSQTQEDGTPAFRRAARIAHEVGLVQLANTDALSHRLRESFSIPRLRTEDVNGDGRKDLVVQDKKVRSFHLLREDGTFPVEPDVSVDLAIFRDTTPEAPLRPGRTLAGTDDAQIVSKDLDNDGIPDHVVVHRRKVWVFPGSSAGPQFTEPSVIFKVAEDVTVLDVPYLDDDDFPDLLLVRVQVPTLGTLFQGLMSNWKVDLAAVGYVNDGEGKFESTPRWTGDLSLRLPSILSIVKNPTAILKEFEDVGSRFREAVEGDYDGDGTGDVLMVSEDGTALQFWFGRTVTPFDLRYGPALRRLFFEDEDRTWTIERILERLGGLTQQRIARITGGREPDRTLPRPVPAGYISAGVLAVDFEGDGRDEVVLIHRREDRPSGVRLDVLPAPR